MSMGLATQQPSFLTWPDSSVSVMISTGASPNYSWLVQGWHLTQAEPMNSFPGFLGTDRHELSLLLMPQMVECKTQELWTELVASRERNRAYREPIWAEVSEGSPEVARLPGLCCSQSLTASGPFLGLGCPKKVPRIFLIQFPFVPQLLLH